LGFTQKTIKDFRFLGTFSKNQIGFNGKVFLEKRFWKNFGKDLFLKLGKNFMGVSPWEFKRSGLGKDLSQIWGRFWRE